jgi:hypothetical protein
MRLSKMASCSLLAFLGLAFTSSAQAGGPGGSFNYETYGSGNQRFVEVTGTLTILNPGEQYLGVWIRTYNAEGEEDSEGEISLNMTTLQFSGGIGDYQMAYFAVVIRYRVGNGPIQTLVSQAYPWKP